MEAKAIYHRAYTWMKAAIRWQIQLGDSCSQWTLCCARYWLSFLSLSLSISLTLSLIHPSTHACCNCTNTRTKERSYCVRADQYESTSRSTWLFIIVHIV